MKSPDQSQRFLFDKHPIRGQFVSLDASWTRIVEQSGLEGRALLLLGEALAAMVLLVDTLKIKGSVILQVRGSGPLGLLVVEASSENQIRGVARQTSEITDEMDLAEIFGSSYFVITIKTEGCGAASGHCTSARSKFCRSSRTLFRNLRSAGDSFLACVRPRDY